MSVAPALRSPLAALEDPAWIVGGGVRDALLGRPVTDIDVAVAGDAEAEARRLCRAHRAQRFPLSTAFGAWRVHGGDLACTVDLTPLQGGTLAEDLSRRDLTVNAMAIPVSGPDRIEDPHGGLRDLDARVLRLVSDGALRSDPVRVLRLVRLAGELGFAIDPVARAVARRDAAVLARSAPERLMEELRRILALPGAPDAIEALDDLAALEALVPELGEGRGMEQTPYHHKDVLGHILEVARHCHEIAADPEPVFRAMAGRVSAVLAEPLADGVSRTGALLLSALMHDVAKPATRGVTPEGRVTFLGHDVAGAEVAEAWCRRMRCANRLRQTVTICVRRHLALGFLVHRQPLSLRTIDRYLRSTDPARVELVVLSVADRLATRGPRTTEIQIARHLEVARQITQWLFRLHDRGEPRPLLSGDDLVQELGRAPGPWLAALVDALREEQVVGTVRTRGQARAFAASWALQHGPT